MLLSTFQISDSADLLDSSWHWEPVAGDVLVGHKVEHHVVLLVGDWDQVNEAPKWGSCQSETLMFKLKIFVWISQE